MQGTPQDNSDLVSSFDMGFSSILTVLQSLETGQKNIINLFDKTIDMFDNIADNIGTTFNTSIGKLGIGGLTNYSKMNYNVSMKALKQLTEINKNLSVFSKGPNIDNSQNQDFSNQKIGGKKNIVYNAKEIFQLNIDKADDKKIKLATDMIKEINNFFTNKKDYKTVEQFFTNIRKEFYLINNVIFKVGQGFLFITASLVALTVVNYAAIIKLATLLPLVGMGLFIFIMMIKKAFSSKGGGGFINGVKDMFKTWSLMKALPPLLIALGKGALFLSISLIFFNAVGYDAILKMSTALLALGFSVKMMVDTEGLGLSTTVNLMLISMLIAAMTFALYGTSKVKWDSVFKLPVFITMLGLGLRIAKFDKLGNIKLMTVLGISLMMIVFSLVQFKEITWENVIKMNIFISGLGLSLRTVRKDISVMAVIAIGMMMLTASMLDFQELNILSIVQIIGVVGLLGVVINKFVLGSGGISGRIRNWTDISGAGGGTGFGLIGFAVGLAMLAGSIHLMSGVSWKTVGQVIIFITALGAVFKLFFSERRAGILGRSNRVMNVPSMIGFGIGMGLLVLALDSVSEIEWGSVFKLIIFIAGIGLAIRIMGKNSKTSGMLGFSLGIGILILALDAMSEIQWESVLKLLVFIAGIAASFKLLGGTGTIKIIAFTFSIGALALVLYQVGKNFNQQIWINIGFFALSIAVMGGVMWLLGKVAKHVVTGIFAAGGIALVSWLMIKALSGMKNISDDWQDYVNFLIGVGVLAGAITILGLLMMIPGAQLVLAGGAIAMGVIAGVTWLMAKALEEIGKLEYDPKKFVQFSEGITRVIGAYIALDPLAVIATAPVSIALIPILLVSLLAIGILKIISITKLNYTNIKGFTIGIATMVNSFNDNVSLIKVGKAAIKSVALLPLLGVMFLASLFLTKISKTDWDKKKLDAFNDMFKNFIESTVTTIKEKSKDIEAAGPSLKNIAKLMNIGTQLAKTVGDIANLKFYEFEVKDGKLVLKNVRQLNDRDFKQVGVSIGKLITALIDPLNALGTNSDTFMIGSEAIPNPFKSNKMSKGIEMVKKISQVFKPLVDAIKSYASLEISRDKKAAYNYVHSLNVIIGTYMAIFARMKNFNPDESMNAIKFIGKFNDIMDDLDIAKFKSFDGKLADFIEKMTNNSKWKKIHYNTFQLAKNLHSAANAINKINLDKAAALENNVKLFVENNNSDKIQEIINKFVELFGLIHNQRIAEINSWNGFGNTNNSGNDSTITLTNPGNTQSYSSMPGVQEINNSKNINNQQQINNNQQQGNNNGNEAVIYKLDQLTSSINSLVLKLNK